MPKFIEPRKPWATFHNLGNAAAEIKIRGEIGAPKESTDFWTGEYVKNPGAAGTFEEFEAELEALGEVTDLTISVYSPGGDYFTGLAIHDRLLRHPANKTCIIDGLCASAATYIPIACQTVKMPSNAQMMIHCAEGCECGNAEDMVEMAGMLQVIDQNIAELYAAKTGKPVADFIDMMTNETWLNGKQCMDLGLATELIPAVKAASSVDPVTNKRTIWNFVRPAAALAVFDTLKPTNRTAASPPTSPMKDHILNALKARNISVKGDETDEQLVALLSAEPVAPAVTNRAAVLNLEDAETAQIFNAAVTAGITAALPGALDAALKPHQDEITNLRALITNGVAASAGAGSPVQGAKAQGEQDSITDQFNAIKDPKERTAFFNKHKAALRAAGPYVKAS